MLKILALCALVALIAGQCSNIKYLTTEGATCDTTTNLCKPELFCNTTTSKCQFYKVIGDACTLDTECSNVGICSQGKCSANNKNAGASCGLSAECASLSCVSGTCAALAVGSSCANTTFCGSPTNALYCAAGTCAAVATSGSACGVVITGKPFVQCAPGLYCVNTDATKNTGTCQTSAAESATCGSASTTITGMYSGPGCSTSRSMLCFLGKCLAITLTGVGSKCDLVSSLQGNTCDVANSVCVNSVCTAYSSVTCNSTSTCGAAAYCGCGSSGSTLGTCVPNPLLAPILSSCLSSSLRRIECQNTVNGQNVQSVCADPAKAFRCCSRDTLVANKDLNLAYCSSGTLTQISVVLAAIVALLAW